MVKLHMLCKYWRIKHVYMFEDSAHKQSHTRAQTKNTQKHAHTKQHNTVTTQQNRTELNAKRKQHTHNTSQHTLMTLLATYKRRHTMNLFDPICKFCTTKNGKESKHFQVLLTTYDQIPCHHGQYDMSVPCVEPVSNHLPLDGQETERHGPVWNPRACHEAVSLNHRLLGELSHRSRWENSQAAPCSAHAPLNNLVLNLQRFARWLGNHLP